MNLASLLNIYRSVKPVRYDVQFIESQLENMPSADSDNNNLTADNKMVLDIVLSALKYYIDASWEAYQDIIFSIVNGLERKYHVSGLLESILEVE